jgi:hypothetical protein
MACENRPDLVSYLKNELSVADRKEADGHIADCPDCRRELEDIRKALTMFEAFTEIQPSQQFTEKTLVALPEALEKREREMAGLASFWTAVVAVMKRRVKHAPIWVLSIAVHVILFGILGLIFIRNEIMERRRETPVVYFDPSKFSGPGYPPVDVKKPDDGSTTPGTGPSHTPTKPDDWPALPPSDDQWPELVEPGKTLPGIEVPWCPQRWPDKIRTPIEESFAGYLSLRADRSILDEALKTNGGMGTEKSVASALAWLAAQQSVDGSWPAVEFDGKAEYTPGLTALCTLAFLAGGNTHKNSATSSATVAKALDWIVRSQDDKGILGGSTGNYMYNHAICMHALLEAYAMTKDPALEAPAKMAVAFTVRAQTREGGWGYREENLACDTSITGWQVMALKLAKGLDFPDCGKALRKAYYYMLTMTDDSGKVGYRAKGNFPNGHEALTGIGMFCFELFRPHTKPELLDRQAKVLLQSPPELNQSPMRNDYYYWYFGSLAMFQHGGDGWKIWNAALRKTLVECQEMNGDNAGSWPPNDKWSGYGGRIYTTALATLSLEVYYRYPRTGR